MIIAGPVDLSYMEQDIVSWALWTTHALCYILLFVLYIILYKCNLTGDSIITHLGILLLLSTNTFICLSSDFTIWPRNSIISCHSECNIAYLSQSSGSFILNYFLQLFLYFVILPRQFLGFYQASLIWDFWFCILCKWWRIFKYHIEDKMFMHPSLMVLVFFSCPSIV